MRLAALKSRWALARACSLWIPTVVLVAAPAPIARAAEPSTAEGLFQ